MCQSAKTEIYSFFQKAGHHSNGFVVVPFSFVCFCLFVFKFGLC